MTEYGVFEDGACIEAGFHGETGKAAAEAHMADLIAAAPDMAGAYEVAEICPDHAEQPANGCEGCHADCPQCGEPLSSTAWIASEHRPDCPRHDPHF